MLPHLTANEVRVIGCLMEKSIVTPEVYPLTLNALTNACNQKSSRTPVMSLAQGVVQRTARDLQAKQLLRIDENFKSGVEKYTHRLCNEHLSEFQFDPAQFAIVCLLLLRGPQTPGELRARSGRLHSFADNEAVVDALSGLIERDGAPVVVKLPRTPGRKDAEYTHLFGGPIDIEALASQAQAEMVTEMSERISVSQLAERVSRLEAEVAELKAQLKTSHD
ncbi:MAG: YceH family protein [Gammaproteobacteria bacterium]|nr:YceH family protein [Gammaproteobacteria bacterium]